MRPCSQLRWPLRCRPPTRTRWAASRLAFPLRRLAVCPASLQPTLRRTTASSPTSRPCRPHRLRRARRCRSLARARMNSRAQTVVLRPARRRRHPAPARRRLRAQAHFLLPARCLNLALARPSRPAPVQLRHLRAPARHHRLIPAHPLRRPAPARLSRPALFLRPRLRHPAPARPPPPSSAAPTPWSALLLAAGPARREPVGIACCWQKIQRRLAAGCRPAAADASGPRYPHPPSPQRPCSSS